MKRVKRYICFFLLIVSVILTACSPPHTSQKPEVQLKVVTLDNTKIVMGQTVYVPVYPYIYTEDRNQDVELTATLSVRNTDLANSVQIASVSYYDTNGKLLRKYLAQPVELGPLAATDFIVERADTSGGVGASFIVEWVAQTKVSEPVVEAVMILTLGNQGISLISNGRVIKSRGIKN